MLEKDRDAKVYIVHRLDRESDGLLLLAHTPDTAAKLSDLFQVCLRPCGTKPDVNE